MDAHFTKNLVPKHRRGSRYDLDDLMFSDSSPTSENFYHYTSQQQKEQISTYEKIVQEMSKDECNSSGTAFVSIHGGGDTIVINPSTGPGTNTTVGGTLILSPLGGIHFKNKPSFSVELQLPSESKDISARLSSSAKSPSELLNFVKQFNQRGEENLCPDVFLEYRDSQTAELSTDLGGTVVFQNNPSNFDISHDSENNNMNYNSLEIQCKNTDNHTMDNKNKISPKTLTKLDAPLTSPIAVSSLNNKVEDTQGRTGVLILKGNLMSTPAPEVGVQGLTGPPTYKSSPNGPSEQQTKEKMPFAPIGQSAPEDTSVSNISEVPELLPEEQKIPVSSVANNPNAFNLISKVHSFPVSSISNATNSINMEDEEHMLVSPMSNISDTASLQANESISTSPSNSTPSIPITPTRGRKLSDSLLGFFTGNFRNSTRQSLSEENKDIKEVAMMAMIFRP